MKGSFSTSTEGKKFSRNHVLEQTELLRSERSSVYNTWQELSDNHLHNRGRFLRGSDKDKARKPYRQVNNTSKLASRTIASGMMSGITSPARPWFRLQAPDPELNEYTPVKQYLHDVMQVMYKVYSQSNTYNSLHALYLELATFGTAAMSIDEDFNSIIRCKTHTAGSYMIGADGTGGVNTFYKEYTLTVAEVVQRFGIENVRESTRAAWESGNTTAEIRIVHAIEPNDDRNMLSPLASEKAYRSVYIEHGGNNSTTAGSSRGDTLDSENDFLRRSGYDKFNVLTPRWEVVDEDVYGSDCPGMTSNGDTRALQKLEKRKYQAFDKIAHAPLMGDPDVIKQIEKGLLPNDMVAVREGQRPLESVYGGYRPDLNAFAAEVNNLEQRISRAWYEDLFLMLANSDRRQITATEIAEKQEEKLLMLGPVLERLQDELLKPLIDITFDKLQGGGSIVGPDGQPLSILPPPPPELEGQELNINYVSVLAQAQRLVAVGGIERFGGFIGNMAGLYPEIRHKFDPLQAADDYAESLGLNPKLVKGNDVVQQAQAAEAQAGQAQQAQAQASQAVDLAARGAEVPVGDDSNLTQELLAQAGLG